MVESNLHEMEHEKAFIAKHPIGIFAFGEKELLEFHPFETPEKAAEQFEQKISDEFYDKIKKIHHKITEGSEAQQALRKKFRAFLHQINFDEKNLNTFLRDFSILTSRKKIKLLGRKDKLIIQASNALDDLAKIQNLMLERLHEWYSLHYPELKLSHKELAETVSKHGKRENFPKFADSVGIDIDEKDEEVFRKQAKLILDLTEQKKMLEKYVKESMVEIAPNFSSLVDALLAARLIALAGSLEKIAKLSSSSIQLLGAEKALFRHLRKMGKSPKFGIIFMSSWIQNAPEENRGKIARILSSKLMQAARIDFYSGRDESQRLKKELEDEISKELGKVKK